MHMAKEAKTKNRVSENVLSACLAESENTTLKLEEELTELKDQVAEFIYATDNLTLGFDSTTQGGVHINAINLHTKSQEFLNYT